MNSRFQIDQLRLRAFGLTREQGHSLGESVARRLGELEWAPRSEKKISSLHVEVRSGERTSVEELADLIAFEIQRRLS